VEADVGCEGSLQSFPRTAAANKTPMYLPGTRKGNTLRPGENLEGSSMRFRFESVLHGWARVGIGLRMTKAMLSRLLYNFLQQAQLPSVASPCYLGPPANVPAWARELGSRMAQCDEVTVSKSATSPRGTIQAGDVVWLLRSSVLARVELLAQTSNAQGGQGQLWIFAQPFLRDTLGWLAHSGPTEIAPLQSASSALMHCIVGGRLHVAAGSA